MTIVVNSGKAVNHYAVMYLTLYGHSGNVTLPQKQWQTEDNWLGGYKTFSMLNSAEHEIYPAHKC